MQRSEQSTEASDNRAGHGCALDNLKEFALVSQPSDLAIDRINPFRRSSRQKMDSGSGEVRFDDIYRFDDIQQGIRAGFGDRGTA